MAVTGKDVRKQVADTEYSEISGELLSVGPTTAVVQGADDTMHYMPAGSINVVEHEGQVRSPTVPGLRK